MTVVCRSCGSENPNDSAFCNACGKRIESPQAPHGTEGKVCPHCGVSNPVVVSFCQNCAKDFQKPEAVHQQRPREHTGRTCWQCGAAIGMDEDICPTCGSDVSPASLGIPDVKRSSNAPVIATVLFLGAGVLDLVSGFTLVTKDVYIPEYGIDLGGMLCACGSLTIIFGFCALAAAFMSYRKERWTLAVLAGALGMVGGGPFGLGFVLSLIGVVLVVRCRGDFRS